MTVAADQVLTDEVFRVYAARPYPVAWLHRIMIYTFPLGSVKSSLYRARLRLRTELSAHAPRS